MNAASPPSASPVSRKEKIFYGLTWFFLIGGTILAIGVTGVTFKHRETKPLNAEGLVLLLLGFGFLAVHFSGYLWSRILAGVAGLLHTVLGLLLILMAVTILGSWKEGAWSGLLLATLWASFHLTLAVLMIKLRFRRGLQTPSQAALAAANAMAKSEAVWRRPTWHWRGYAIYSTFHNELADSTSKWPRWPVIRLLGWTVGWIPYLGIMVSAFALSLLPTVALGSWFRLGPSSAVYWVFAPVAVLVSAGLFGWAGRSVIRQWRQKIVDVESLALLAGAALALLGAAVYFPQGAARFF